MNARIGMCEMMKMQVWRGGQFRDWVSLWEEADQRLVQTFAANDCTDSRLFVSEAVCE